jgi:hypothetical protein
MSESEPTSDPARLARQRDTLAQALDLIRRRELRVLGALPRRRWRRPVASGDPLPRTTLVKTTSTINAEADAGDRALMEMFADGKMRGPSYRRFVLVRRETGELEFEQDELDAIFDEVLAEAFGRPKPKPRVIKIDAQSAPRGRRPRRRSPAGLHQATRS